MKKKTAALFLLLALFMTVLFGCAEKDTVEESSPTVEGEIPVQYVSADGDILSVYLEGGTYTITFSSGATETGSFSGGLNALILKTDGGDKFVSLSENGYFTLVDMSVSDGDSDPASPAVCDHSETTIQGRVESTCEEAGYSGDEVCLLCGKKILLGAVMPAKGHVFTEETEFVCRQGFCTNNETRYYGCAVCGKVSSDENDTYEVPNSASGHHSYTAISDVVYKAATCADNQVNYACCAVCGDISYAVTLEVEGTATQQHTFDAPSTQYYIEPDCGHNARYFYSCSVCGLVSINPSDTYEAENTIIGSHSFTVPSGRVKAEATCVHDRVEYAACAVCGLLDENYEITIPGTATGVHLFTELSDVEAQKETCVTDRYVYSRCKFCGAISREKTMRVVATALDHLYYNHYCVREDCTNRIDPNYKKYRPTEESDPVNILGDVSADQNYDSVEAFLYEAESGGVYEDDLVLFGGGAIRSYYSSSATPWANYLNRIKNVYVYGEITGIGDYCFADMTRLTKVSFIQEYTTYNSVDPASSLYVVPPVTRFGNYVFYGCSSLATITLPTTTTTIGMGSFAHCDALASINTSSLTALTSVGANLFREDPALVSIDLSATALTALPQETFARCSALATVRFPAGLREIGAYAFYQTPIVSTSGSPLTFPASLRTIRAYAFADCSFLEEIDLSATSLLEIGDRAFAGDDRLSTLNLPSGITTIGKHILVGTAYYADSSNWLTSGGNSFLYLGGSAVNEYFIEGNFVTGYTIAGAGTELNPNPKQKGWYEKSERYFLSTDSEIDVDKKYYLLSGSVYTEVDTSNTSVTDPTQGGWYEKGETHYYLTTDTTVIGSKTYYQLTTAEFSAHANTVTIAAGALENCLGVSKVILSSATKYVGKDAFKYCTNLSSVNLSSVQTIGSGAFYSCAKLITVSLPATVSSVGEKAFASCTLLRSFAFREGVTIPQNALEGVSLFELYYPLSYTGSMYGAIAKFGGDFSRTSTVVSDGEFVYAYYNNVGYLIGCLTPEATEITLPDSFTFTISETPMEVTSYRIYKKAFCQESYYSQVKVVTLPTSVTAIEDEAFAGCSYLEKLNVPLSVTEIGVSILNGTAYYLDNRLNGLLYLESSEKSGDKSQYFLIDVLQSQDVDLRRITIKDDTVLIADEAFAGCTVVTELILPSSVNYMGKNLLNDCVNITTLSIPFIGSSKGAGGYEESYLAYLFGGSSYEDNKVASGFIPTSLTTLTISLADTLESNSLRDCTTLTSLTLRLARVFKSHCLDGCKNVSITFSDGVKEVGDYAFNNCEKLSSIAFSGELESIGSYAFYNTGLMTVSLQISTTSVGEYAFAHSRYLYEVSLGDGVNYVGTRAFYNCISLIRVFVGKAMKKGGVKSEAFSWCMKLVEVYNTSEATGEERFSLTLGDSGEGEIARYAKNITKGSSILSVNGNFRMMTLAVSQTVTEYYLVGYTGPGGIVELPGSFSDTVAANYHIYDYAFAGNEKIVQISMPRKVSMIGAYSFSDCKNMTAVTFSSSTARIGVSAFARTGLVSIEFPTSMRTVSSEAFFGCKSLTTIRFGTGVMEIGQRAFAECTAITQLSFPSTLNTIHSEAFLNCNSVRSLSMPSSVNSIGASAFKDCTGLETVTWNSIATLDGTQIFDNAGTKEGNGGISVDFSMLTRVPAYLFYVDKSTGVTPRVKSITFGSTPTLREIGDFAFYGLEMRAVTLPNSLLTIGDFAFGECVNLTMITLPDSVTTVGAGGFSACSALTTVTLSESLRAVSASMFYGCSNIGAIYLPDSVSTIGENAFSGCTSLKNIAMHCDLTSIAEGAFGGCENLEYVYVLRDDELSAESGNHISSGNSYFLAATFRYVYFQTTVYAMISGGTGYNTLNAVDSHGYIISNEIPATYISSNGEKVGVNSSDGRLTALQTTAAGEYITITVTVGLGDSGLQVIMTYRVQVM